MDDPIISNVLEAWEKNARAKFEKLKQKRAKKQACKDALEALLLSEATKRAPILVDNLPTAFEEFAKEMEVLDKQISCAEAQVLLEERQLEYAKHRVAEAKGKVESLKLMLVARRRQRVEEEEEE